MMSMRSVVPIFLVVSTVFTSQLDTFAFVTSSTSILSSPRQRCLEEKTTAATTKMSIFEHQTRIHALLSSSSALFVQSEVLVEVSSGNEEEEDGGAEEVEQFEQLEGPLSGEEINARLEQQLEKMRLKDQTSKQLSKEDLVIIYEDTNMLVLDKPSGVLTVAGKDKSIPCLAKAVFDNIDKGDDLPTADHMVVHRLGMDTSGLIMMAKNRAALRILNGVFRERKVERRYEALVAGHMERDHGLICLPVMRDYQCPPYVRISTLDHQHALSELDPEVVGKKLLEWPKESITKYEVMAKEYLEGYPVTRVTLTSISGRYHQLNVHLAAIGHPIVGDTVYGIDGEALPNGGLNKQELKYLTPNKNRASVELQRALADVVDRKQLAPCIHAKYIKFTHPYTKKVHEFTTESPF